jgi:uncharacterized membrane protein YgcG
MRRWPYAVLLLAVAIVVTPAFAQEGITDFHSDVSIQPDASLIVHEVIQVYSEAAHIRHGIFRDFPTRYKDRTGQSYVVNFQLLGVRRDGKDELFTQEDLNNGVRIKIGSATTLLDAGAYTYELTYTVNREIGFFPDHDELYWNVTGNGWQFPIDHASATVTLPGPVQAADLQMTGYTGFQGSRERNLTFERATDTTVRFETTRPLGSGQGLTIVVGFPKGLLNEPSQADRVRWWMQDNKATVTGLLGLMLVIIYYFGAWMAVGRNPQPGPIVISYEPPPGLSPAAMCFLDRMGYDDRVFVSAVVDLAVKGYLRIEQVGSLYTLKNLKPADGKLPVEEHNLLRILLGSRDEIPVAATDAITFSAAKKTLNSDLELEENNRFFHKNRRWAVPGILLTLAILAVMVMSLHGSTAAGAGFLTVWLSFWTVGCVFLVRTAISSWKSGKGSIALTLFAIPFLITEVVVIGILTVMLSVWAVLILIAIAVANGIGIAELKALTPEGRKLIDQTEGFRQFLTAVDSDRLQRMSLPAKTPQLFEKCLPYALALGVEQAWAKQFTAVLAQAAVATGGAVVAYSPLWISSTDWDSFNASTFAGDFTSGFSSAVSSASSPPGSSSGFSDSGGGGDGGSSGGGGGGGGGGGW